MQRSIQPQSEMDIQSTASGRRRCPQALSKFTVPALKASTHVKSCCLQQKSFILAIILYTVEKAVLPGTKPNLSKRFLREFINDNGEQQTYQTYHALKYRRALSLSPRIYRICLLDIFANNLLACLLSLSFWLFLFVALAQIFSRGYKGNPQFQEDNQINNLFDLNHFFAKLQNTFLSFMKILIATIDQDRIGTIDYYLIPNEKTI